MRHALVRAAGESQGEGLTSAPPVIDAAMGDADNTAASEEDPDTGPPSPQSNSESGLQHALACALPLISDARAEASCGVSLSHY